MGGMNYHVEIIFEDGITWIARIRRFNATSPPAALRDYILQNSHSSSRAILWELGIYSWTSYLASL